MLEENFQKLNYINKIQILLKALVMEREKNRENGVRLSVMKREYILKVQKIKSLIDENETLLEKVAQAEIDSEQKDVEIKTL